MHARNLTNRFARFILPAAVLVVVISACSAASACPSCQAALAGDEAHGDLARGIYYSILFMMSMPFAIVGTFGTLAYRTIKREQRKRDAEKAAQEDAK
jgi:heme/copper-type cytochrome/quinol oxidase subunit 2